MKRILLLMVFGLTSLLCNAQNPSVCFNAESYASSHTVDVNPLSIVKADFNNDGTPDLATANWGADNVSVLLGTGTCSFAPSVNYPVGNVPFCIASADFNNDGNADLVVANKNSSNVSILIGSGTGTFASTVNYSAGIVPNAVTTGDFNNDGKIDLAVVDYNQAKVVILAGSGTGTFIFSANFSCGFAPGSISAGDLNNDSNLDLVVGISNGVSVLMGTGTGSFAAAFTYTTVASPNSVFVADLNGDNQPDIVAPYYTTGSTAIFINIGTGIFAAPVFYNTGSASMAAVTGDYNTDGKIDLAVANWGSGDVSVLLGFGNGTFGVATNFIGGSNAGLYALTSGDFNNDGAIDLATANFNTNNVTILRGSGAGTFASSINYSVGFDPRSVSVGDFNNDGKTDIATANYGSNNVSVILGTGTGSFGASTNFSVGTSPHSICNNDFNNDGNADLAVANYSSNTISILLGSGTGNFSLTSTYTIGFGNTRPTSVISRDFNNDGNSDIAIAVYNASQISVWFGSGTGTFSLSANYNITFGPFCLIASDLNNDGNLDLASSNISGAAAVSVLLGSPSGTFGTAVNYGVAQYPYSLTCGDFNGDGKPDLATANYNSNNVSVIMGLGTGSFSTAVNYTIGAFPYSITNHDFNNDGYLDLAVANWGGAGAGGDVALLLGTSSGSFTVIPTVYGTGSAADCVNKGDFNGDGKMDLVISNFGPDNVTILLNGIMVYAVSANSICTGNSATITASGASTYSWSTGSNASSIVVSPTVTSTYSVIGTVTAGCSFTAVKTISVNISPSISVNSGSVCSGSSFTMFPVGANTYTFQGGSAIVSPTVTSNYTVVGTSTSGCISQLPAVSNITVNALPILTATSNINPICVGQNATLTVTGANTYSWSSGGTSTNEVISPTTNTNYTVTGIDINGCINTTTLSQIVTICTGLTASFKNSEYQFQFYPNPSSGEITVKLNTGSNKIIEISDIMGRIVLLCETFSDVINLNINSFENGVYSLKIQSNNCIEVVKIVKQ